MAEGKISRKKRFKGIVKDVTAVTRKEGLKKGAQVLRNKLEPEDSGLRTMGGFGPKKTTVAKVKRSVNRGIDILSGKATKPSKAQKIAPYAAEAFQPIKRIIPKQKQPRQLPRKTLDDYISKPRRRRTTGL